MAYVWYLYSDWSGSIFIDYFNKPAIYKPIMLYNEFNGSAKYLIAWILTKFFNLIMIKFFFVNICMSMCTCAKILYNEEFYF